MTQQTDVELAVLRALDNQKLLDGTANRENVQSITANNLALSRLVDARARLRNCLARCAVVVCTLIVAWSVWFWVR